MEYSSSGEIRFKRTVEDPLKRALFKGKVVILYGARQVGKTTLVKKILDDYRDLRPVYINADEGDYKRLLNDAETSTALKQIVGDSPLVVIDEAQRVKDIGLKLKLLVDNFPNQQIIATGSSSFELSSKIVEPLTGRALEFWLYPLSVEELLLSWDRVMLNRMLESLLIFGSYPGVVTTTPNEYKEFLVKEISSNYLYKDILKFNNLNSSELVVKLLSALALQIGNEVSFRELGQLLGLDRRTVENYVELLEKAFVIFRLGPYSHNQRKELGKLRKIYFYDTGVRNSLINNLNPLSLRDDVGRLWENFIVSEWKKKEVSMMDKRPLYFWRTYDKQEIDLVDSSGGGLKSFEIKWNNEKEKPPKAWGDLYPNASWSLINNKNFLDYLVGNKTTHVPTS